MMRAVVGLFVGTAVVLGGSSLTSASGVENLEIDAKPRSFSTYLGRTVTLEVSLTNASPSSSGPMTAHLMIVDPAGGKPLDPEDWTDAIAQKVSPIEAGGVSRFRWVVSPIAQGEFGLFVIVVPAFSKGGEVPLSSAVVPLSVGSPRASLGMAIPVAATVPSLLAAVLLGQVLAIKRKSARVRSSTHQDG